MAQKTSYLSAKQTILALVIVGGGLLLWVTHAESITAFTQQHPLITRCLVWSPLAGFCGFLLLLALRGQLISKHVSSGIVDRLQAGDATGASKLAEQLLTEHPDDMLVKINAVAAFHRAGRLADARRCLSEIDPKSLQRSLKSVYDGWKTTLG